MRRRYVKLVETGEVFKSLAECDKFLGAEGLTSTILNYPNNYHPRYDFHVVEITKQEYDENLHITYDSYKDIVHTYQIACKWCGRFFHPENIHQFYCTGDHIQTCSVCEKQFDITDLLKQNRDIPSTCSKECSILARKSTIKERQKDPNYEKSKLEKRRKTCMKKYGVDNVSKSSEVKSKIIESLEAKYDVDNPANLPQA